MTPSENTSAVPNLAEAHPGPRVARLLRGAFAWAAFLGVAAGLAHLVRSREAPVSSRPPGPVLENSVAQVRSIAATAFSGPIAAPSWPAQLDAIAKDGADPSEIFRRLRDLWPSLPEDGQMDVLRRMVNLLPDSDYGMMREFAATAKLPAASWDTLATDALTRPDRVKLPVLLEIVAHGGEPARGEARMELVEQLGADYGEDWARWKAAMATKSSKPE